MIFKVIPHLMLNKTHLITGLSNINSTESLAEKMAIFVEKRTFWNLLNKQLNLTHLEH